MPGALQERLLEPAIPAPLPETGRTIFNLMVDKYQGIREIQPHG
jgi:hypothetical protein